MDLVEINYHDYLAECTSNIGEDITCWFKGYLEKNYMLSYYKDLPENEDSKISIDDIQFRVGDDLISLSEGVYEKEPRTDLSSEFGGRLATLAMLATVFIKDGKLKGKMRIYNPSKPPVDTRYELVLERAEMKMLVGLKICGDGWDYDNCKYKFVKSDLSFKYYDNDKAKSVFDRETDTDKRKLLEQYMLEYITKELGPALEYYQTTMLSIKALVSNSVGADYSLKNMLSIHNKKLRKAFNILSEKIISIANSLLVKKSPELHFTELFGLNQKEGQKNYVQVYTGYIDNFGSLALAEGKNTIISNDGDLVIVHVPVEFKELKLHIVKLADGSSMEHKEQTYETSGSHFIMSLKRLSENEARISLMNFKVLNIKPTCEAPINVAMDHLIASAIEQHMKPFLEEAMTYKELQELAIKPDVEIEYDPHDDLMAEDSEEEED